MPRVVHQYRRHPDKGGPCSTTCWIRCCAPRLTLAIQAFVLRATLMIIMMFHDTYEFCFVLDKSSERKRDNRRREKGWWWSGRRSSSHKLCMWWSTISTNIYVHKYGGSPGILRSLLYGNQWRDGFCFEATDSCFTLFFIALRFSTTRPS